MLVGVSAMSARLPDVASTSQLKALLSTPQRFKALPPGSTTGAQRLEFFSPDGRYQGCGDRAMLVGRYIVTRAGLCTSTGGAETCRKLRRAKSGAYSQQFTDADGAQSPLTPVEVAPASKADNCMHSGG
jgi:hypothetical protein